MTRATVVLSSSAAYLLQIKGAHGIDNATYSMEIHRGVSSGIVDLAGQNDRVLSVAKKARRVRVRVASR